MSYHYTTYLIDTENCVTLRDWSQIPDGDQVIFFVSDRTPSLNEAYKALGFAHDMSVIWVNSSLHNAMDNRICEWIWNDYHNAEDNVINFYVIVSDDKEYDLEITHMGQAGIFVERRSLQNNKTKQLNVPILPAPKSVEDTSSQINDGINPLSNKRVIRKRRTAGTPFNDNAKLEEALGLSDISSVSTEQKTSAQSTKAKTQNVKQKATDSVCEQTENVPQRTINKQKRTECKQYLISLGFTATQAQAICRGMNPATATHIITKMYPNNDAKMAVHSRITTRLKGLKMKTKDINKLVNLVMNNAKIKK